MGLEWEAAVLDFIVVSELGAESFLAGGYIGKIGLQGIRAAQSEWPWRSQL